MIDGHVHVTAQLLPYLRDVTCMANAQSPEEYAFLKAAGLPLISAGIHPWKADRTAWAEMEPILREVPVIGEIGLDLPWCSVDMDTQREVFHKQLSLAAAWNKPVVLHTKGMEGEVLDTIRQYPNRYLVHWYSHPEHLEEYIRLGCWFTVGQDLADPAVRRVAESVPLNRLLIESDGVEALAWVQNRDISVVDYPAEMENHLRAVAGIRGVSPAALLGRMEENLKEFVG